MKKIKEENANLKIFYSKYKIKNPEYFRNKKVVAFFAGIEIQNFFDLLEENNINIKKTFSFPDHHNYSKNDFSNLIEQKSNESDVLLLTTEKDYFRLNDEIKENFNYIEVHLEIENRDKFINFIKSKI